MRASIREAPSLSLYTDVDLRGPIDFYTGARTGLVSLVGGRGYVGDTAVEVDGSTFQLGPVLGLVAEVKGLNIFLEGSYMWRNIKSLEWDSGTDVPDLPHSANLSGPAIAFGVQFQFKKPGS
jgi:hypothetical protein